MKREHGKIRALLCAAAVCVAVALTGCANGDSTAAGGKAAAGGLSRAEYIGMLGKSFGYDTYISETDIFSDVASTNEYYAEIQAAAEWQIIDSGQKFEPDKAASVSFALESAVRAIGTDDIAASGAAIDLGHLAEFYTGNIAQIDLSDADAPIDATVAGQIIAYAKGYDSNLVLPQITQMEFAEGVKIADRDIWLNADGVTGIILVENQGYSVGDIVYLDATDTSLAKAIKITGINGNTFTFVEASVEETFTYLNIRGTFPGKVVEVISASDGAYAGLGQEIYDEMKAYNTVAAAERYELVQLATTTKMEQGSDYILCKASFDVEESTSLRNNGKVEASADGQLVIGIKNISADVEYEWGVFAPKEVRCTLHYDTEVSSEINGSVSASIPLGEAFIQLVGPVNLKLSLIAHLGADGSVSISYTTENVMNVEWKKGTGLGKSFDSKPQANFEADATLTADATLLADVRIFGGSVVNAQVTCGAVAKAKTEADLLGDQPVCVDLQLYVTLKWGVNQEPCLITFINSDWKYSGTIWDSSNSPVQIHMHLEDWKRTAGDVCTRKEAVKQELVTPEGEPLEEIDPFDFEPIKFDFIELVSYTMYLNEGGSMNIGFANIPEGYSQADLKYEVLDPAVCSVSNGTVRGNAAGSTIVKISTGDGMLTVSIAVTVNEDYTVEGFQSL